MNKFLDAYVILATGFMLAIVGLVPLWFYIEWQKQGRQDAQICKVMGEEE